MKAPIFVVGHGRCGTRSLSYIWNHISEVISFHEPEPQFLREAKWRMDGGLSGSCEHYHARLRDSRVALSFGHRYYAEATHWFCWLVSDIYQIWPDAKVVWLRRDRAPWAWSAWRKGWYHSMVDGRREWADSLRPEPPGGWPPGASRWFKLGYLHRRVEVHLDRQRQVRSNAQFREFATEDLNDLEKLAELTEWAGLPEMEGDLRIRANTGDMTITLGELERAGVDLAMFGIENPSSEVLEDIVAVEHLESLGVKLGGWKPPRPEITPEIDAEMDAGSCAALLEVGI